MKSHSLLSLCFHNKEHETNNRIHGYDGRPRGGVNEPGWMEGICICGSMFPLKEANLDVYNQFYFRVIQNYFLSK